MKTNTQIAMQNIIKNNAVIEQLMQRHEYDAEQALEWCVDLLTDTNCHVVEGVLEQMDLEVNAENIDALNRIIFLTFGPYPTPSMGGKR